MYFFLGGDAFQNLMFTKFSHGFSYGFCIGSRFPFRKGDQLLLWRDVTIGNDALPHQNEENVIILRHQLGSRPREAINFI